MTLTRDIDQQNVGTPAALSSLGRVGHAGGGAVRADGPTAGLSTARQRKQDLEKVGLQVCRVCAFSPRTFL